MTEKRLSSGALLRSGHSWMIRRTASIQTVTESISASNDQGKHLPESPGEFLLASVDNAELHGACDLKPAFFSSTEAGGFSEDMVSLERTKSRFSLKHRLGKLGTRIFCYLHLWTDVVSAD